MITVYIPGEPVPQNVGKVGRWKTKDAKYAADGKLLTGRAGTTMRQSSKVNNYKAEVRLRMRRACGGVRGSLFGDRPVALRIVAVFELPKARHRKRHPVTERAPHTSRYGDCDNLTKAIGDAGEGILWEDDGQIFDLHVTKWWGAQGEPPSVTIEVLTEEEWRGSPEKPLPPNARGLFD